MSDAQDWVPGQGAAVSTDGPPGQSLEEEAAARVHAAQAAVDKAREHLAGAEAALDEARTGQEG